MKKSLTNREILGREIVRLQELLKEKRHKWKTMEIEDCDEEEEK